MAPHMFKDIIIQQIETWTEECLEQHAVCRNSWTLYSEVRKLPTRLLEVYDDKNLPILRLLHTMHLSQQASYITLSHCWGTKPCISLRGDSLSTFSRSIPFNSLSQTFRDAITLTRLLGCRYLWIDSLCILQDSMEDWLRESASMAEVYSQALLNIAAAASKDGDGGLISKARSLATSPCVIKDARGNGIHSIEPPNRFHGNVENSPLGNRGWVLQERLLSPRVVHFASDQLYWECCSHTDAEFTHLGSEAIPSTKGLHDDLHSNASLHNVDLGQDHLRRSRFHKSWSKLVTRYSRCKLTVASDKLAAISGLAQRTCRQFRMDPSDYVAGSVFTCFIPFPLKFKELGLPRGPLRATISPLIAPKVLDLAQCSYVLR